MDSPISMLRESLPDVTSPATSSRQAPSRCCKKANVQLVRYPRDCPEALVTGLLKRLNVDLVWDVGANDGDYACDLRSGGYRGRIVSFEPGAEAFNRLVRRSHADQLWSAHSYALGASSDPVVLNIAGNDGRSSSALPMLDSHRDAAPDSEYLNQETIEQKRLDDISGELSTGATRRFLKIDTQGFEADVLRGATDSLSSIVGVQVETSLQPLYAGAPELHELLSMLAGAGFHTRLILPGFQHPDTMDLLQADFVMVRNGELS